MGNSIFPFTISSPLNEIQTLQDQFALTSNLASIITDTNGNAITRPSNFNPLCRFIRNTEKGEQTCIKEDSELGKMSNGLIAIRKCRQTGFWHGGTIISVNGHPIAYWLVGQAKCETDGEERIRKYARQIGLDEVTAAEAYSSIPFMEEKRFRKIAEFLHTLGKSADGNCLSEL